MALIRLTRSNDSATIRFRPTSDTTQLATIGRQWPTPFISRIQRMKPFGCCSKSSMTATGTKSVSVVHGRSFTNDDAWVPVAADEKLDESFQRRQQHSGPEQLFPLSSPPKQENNQGTFTIVQSRSATSCRGAALDPRAASFA